MKITSYKLKNEAIVICSDEKPKGLDLCLYGLDEILSFDEGEGEIWKMQLCQKVKSIVFEDCIFYVQPKDSLINKNVIVDISCADVGFMYPENNILVGIEPTKYVFKSDQIESEDGLWMFPLYSDGCSIELTLVE